MVAKDIAKPLIFVGNISEISTHGIGPSEEEKLAMKPNMKINVQILELRPK
jgi:hypothetical protein